MQEQIEKKNSNFPSRALLLGVAVVIGASIAYHFWPKAKGFWQTAKASVGLNKDVSLTGVLYTEDNPSAIVDGRIVHEGDVIGGVKVVKIHKGKVDFERSGRRWSQRMPAAAEGISSGLPVLLQLGSHKCPPCRQMTPILNELRTKYTGKFRIRYIDVWKNRAAGFEYGVRAIPTQIFYDNNGREVFRHVGFYSREEILATWKQMGIKL
ncbi:MAG: thioredoxin domain-containing protein [Planctomycetota bacterium]|jgi:thioredoxin 1